MKIIEPKVELWKQEDAKAHVARCARICYRKETGNDEKLIEHLNKVHHWSMFRHETIYAKVLVDKEFWHAVMSHYIQCPYIDWINYGGKYYYIVTNGNFLRDIKEVEPVLYNWLIRFTVDKSEFENIDITHRNLMRYTFCIDTQISISRELNRVSPNNISEQSTRYVYEDGTICRPWWLNDESIKQYYEEPIVDTPSTVYLDSCNDSFKRYKFLVENGMDRQDARGVLPLDTATRCVYTYSIKEWRHIIELRSDKRAHPNAQIIANMIKSELEQLGYDF